MNMPKGAGRQEAITTVFVHIKVHKKGIDYIIKRMV